ncbi:MAG: hypothetical protein Q9162_002115 [Coniocarpon cinnabarinum]
MSADKGFPRSYDDGQVSPGSCPKPQSQRADIAPWDTDVPPPPPPKNETVNHQNFKLNSNGPSAKSRPNPHISQLQQRTGQNKAAVMSKDSGNYTSSNISVQPPSESQASWLNIDENSPDSERHAPFLHNSSEDQARRPSVQSFATASSSGSGASRVKSKRLQGWFGEDDLTRDLRSKQELKTTGNDDLQQKGQHSSKSSRSRNQSNNQSPGHSQPRTPNEPSSDVTPWLYQDAGDISYFGDAPVRSNLTEQDATSRARTNTSSKASSSHHHRFPFHRHRATKSSEDPAVNADSGNDSHSLRQMLSKSEPFPGLQKESSRNQGPQITNERSPSPPPFSVDQVDGNSKRISGDSDKVQKRQKLLNVFRSRHKTNDREEPEQFRPSTPSGSVSFGSKLTREASKSNVALEIGAPLEPTSSVNRPRTATRPGPSGDAGKQPSKRDNHSRIPFISRRTATSTEVPKFRDPNQISGDRDEHGTQWVLNTDLKDMSGIVAAPDPTEKPLPSAINKLEMVDMVNPSENVNANWDAPDSWAVKRKGQENDMKLHEIDREGPAENFDTGVPHSIRLYKTDGSFKIVSRGLNTTTAELISLMGQQSNPQDDVNHFQIVMQKGSTSRQLDPGERPLLIQMRLLEQAGYDETDHIEEIGRDDNSYLCRFTYMPAKMIGYSVHDKDLNFNTKQKFSNVDLHNRSLNTIPIALYQKSSEIVFLNLSHNLNLDVPKDFVQGCTSLRELRYTGNEAVRLPQSFCLANRLTVLDVSNNRLESLEGSDLETLPTLASLKVANNRLKHLPQSFSHFRSLRSLNLSSNSLESLPEAICHLKSLVDLDISFNAIEHIHNVSGLVNLEKLWATNNKLSGKPEDGVVNLKRLKEVDIRFNQIDNIDALSQLPELEHLTAGHNSISSFDGSFTKAKTLYLDHNPMTQFKLAHPVPTLSILSLASGKLSQLPEDLFSRTPGLTKLVLTKNHFAVLSPQIGRLQKLDHLSIAKNSLSTLPSELGHLHELRFLDVRENNINVLPQEIWLCRRLETFNLSSNVLDSWPKPPSQPALSSLDTSTAAKASQANTPGLQNYSPVDDDGDTLSELASQRRPSAASSGYMSSTNSSPPASHRKGSMVSIYGAPPGAPPGRKPSALSRAPTLDTMSPISRKDSLMMNKMISTICGSLKHLQLADNRIGDEVFDQLTQLSELRALNLSYNEIYEIPPRTLKRWQHLTELYLSGNDLTSLPSEDFEDSAQLKVLHINCNKFQVLPAELGKVTKLQILDVSCNSLKYNVTNWPYDWNWNWNRQLKYLNLSANKRLEIRPGNAYAAGRDSQNLTDFSTLSQLRVLGLMDVTLMTHSVPEQTEDRRVRTSGSNVGSMAYGISDTLGHNEHLSTIDIVVPRLEGHDDETLIGLFDGSPSNKTGSKIVKYLQENFKSYFTEHLKRRGASENAGHAFRRTYLELNKELSTLSFQSHDPRERKTHRGSVVSQTLTEEDLKSGAVATVLYLHGMTLWVSNVGNAEAILIRSEGGYRVLTQKHDPAETSERSRIRDAGGFVSRQGKLNDAVDVSRGFGFTHLVPAMVAAPHVSEVTISDSDEMILLASREMWDYLSPDFAVDLARSERNDLMRAALRLRDLAIAFGASSKMTVMLIGVSDLRRRERARYRTHSMSMGPSGLPDEYSMSNRRANRGRDRTLDSKLARLDQEVEAPVGDVSLVFTDIKNSTLLWETYEVAMRSAIKMHNELMRRHLRLIGGYEVKTEGDAFMVAFPTVTSALLWAFTIQSQLLEVPWPQEILNSVNGQEVADAEGNVLFRGLSVRMGIHWGQPVWETDPITRRMDYFGPMVNRAARISGVADGGQITVSSDFIAEVQRLLETHIESDRSNSNASEDTVPLDDPNSYAIKRELRSLSSHGFEVKDLGERRLKGLENAEYIYLMYPHSLAGRLAVQQQRDAAAAQAAKEGQSTKTAKDSQLTIELDNVWDLWSVSLRLEMLCSTLESPGSAELKPPETALLERTKERSGEVTDRFLMNFVEHQISRIETCINTLSLRNLVRPFKNGIMEGACPMADVFAELAGSLKELETLRSQVDIEMAAA